MRYNKLIIFLLSLIISVFPLGIRAEEKAERPSEVKVKAVVDGDTVILDNGDTLRYIGINAPENGYTFFLNSELTDNILTRVRANSCWLTLI
jgi:micrococcal nuclease